MQTFAVYVDNKPGVLNRVSSLFRRRAFNIESLTVGHTELEGLSRMTIVVNTDERGAKLVEANLYKLLPVRRVDNITRVPTIARDLAMIKVSATGDARTQVMQLVDVYRARIVDVSADDRGAHAGGGAPECLRAAFVALHGDDRSLVAHKSGQVRGLAAGGGAEVEDAVAGLGVERA